MNSLAERLESDNGGGDPHHPVTGGTDARQIWIAEMCIKSTLGNRSKQAANSKVVQMVLNDKKPAQEAV